MSNQIPIQNEDQLYELFRTSEKPPERWLLGVEAEKLGVHESGAPLSYSGENDIQGLLQDFQRRGWTPQKETNDGPVIALKTDGKSITLEPGAALELSGSPWHSVHDAVSELEDHLTEVAELSLPRHIKWLHLGFHPWAKQEDLSWVPKQRYAIMREYLPTKGSRALDMMRRTATVQVNLDYASEADAMHKLSTLLRLTPFLQAAAANSPFIEGQVSPLLSERIDVWLNMDPERSGLIKPLWDNTKAGYEDYVHWALDAGMFLIRRGDNILVNAGQSFRSFLKDGYQGERATLKDWEIHLATLFPDVRLKSTLEVRGADALPPDLAAAVPALLAGISYDSGALSQTRDLLSFLNYESAVELQRQVSRHGLHAACNGKTAQYYTLKLFELAEQGLKRRALRDASGRDESHFLRPLWELVERGITPAELHLQRYKASGKTLKGYLLQDE